MRRWLVVGLIWIVLISFALAVADDEPCFDDTWSYSPKSGKCYKYVGRGAPQVWSQASWSCMDALSPWSTVPVRLVQFNDETELQALISTMLQTGNMDPIWLGAERQTGEASFHWQNETAPLNPDYVDWPSGLSNDNCIQLSYLTDQRPTSANWKADVLIEQVSCTQKVGFFCEHTVVQCTNPPGGFDASSMVFRPPKPVPKSVVQAICKPGTFMTPPGTGPRATGSNVNESLKQNEYYCGGRRSSATGMTGADPRKFQAAFTYSGYAVTGCAPIECDKSQLDGMVPKNGFLSSARNPATERVYSRQQQNEFRKYGNVITIRCDSGFLFADRSVEKTVLCTLDPHSETKGIYVGYTGTVLPIPDSCEATTCVYETAVIKPEHHMKPWFLVKNGTGDWQNMSRHEGIPYALGARIRYMCQDGFETVNQNADLNITCADSGFWDPQLIGCIAKTASLPSSSSGRFQTEPEESKSAKQISSIMFILIFIFLGFILLLDLTTAGRDAKQLWSNLKLQKRRLNRHRHKVPHADPTASVASSNLGDSGDVFGDVRNRSG